MDKEKMSFVQKLFTKLAGPDLAARMEADSRLWMVQCARCGYERSIWEMGGIRYKAAGTSRSYMRCLQCGKRNWHKIYRASGVSDSASTPGSLAPATAADAKSRRFRLSWGLVGLVLGIVALGAVMAFLIFTLVSALTQPVVTAGDSFMSALKTGDYVQAYSLCTPDLQKELGGASQIATLLQNRQPIQWNWSSRSIRNGVGRVDGSFTDAGGKVGAVHLVFSQVGDNWKITSFRLDMK